MKRAAQILLAALMIAAPVRFAVAAEKAAPVQLSETQMDGVTAGLRNWGSINFAIISQSASAIAVAGGAVNIGSLNIASASAFNFASIQQY